MKKNIVLAEKPSVARDIARVLNCQKKADGYMEGKEYVVTWALGHLVTLASPETYNQKYKTWKLEDLPMLPEPLKLTTIKQTSKQYNTVRRLLNRNDIGKIIIATDSAREGELVARWIIKQARVNKPIKRLWISSVTDKAIRDGFRNLKPGKHYENLYQAAVARSEADWYVGLNATRALTTKFNAQLSAGRVQTPTLGIIAIREESIRQFRPRKYYGLQAKAKNGLSLNWHDSKNNSRIFNKEQVDRLNKKLHGKPLSIRSISKNKKRQYAPALYDLTELQRDANRLFGFSGQQTLRAMQQLYERHKILSYPRTDSRVITSDIVPTLKDRLRACAVDEYAAIANKLVNKQFHLPKSVVNDKQVTDHHAIIPTEEPVFLDELGSNERKIYDLVIKRFLAVLSDPYEYEEVRINAHIDKETFSKRDNITLKLGWKEIYGESKEERSTNLETGQSIKVSLAITEGETTAPARMTEGELLKAMENPTKYMENIGEKLTRTLQEAGGIGTVATRASIIERLIDGQYIEQRGKFLHLTPTGKQLLELAPEDLRSPALTAEWENKLLQIEKGQLKKEQFIKEIKAYTKDIVQQIKAKEASFKHDNITGTKCPRCDELMLEIENRHGKMLRCRDRSCNYKRNVYKNTNARCPNCRKKLKLYGEGDGQMFSCTCGHREKLETFQKRRKKAQNTRVSKKEVNKYLKKQDDGFTNNPFADALSKLKK